jgi:hypothetical protein
MIVQGIGDHRAAGPIGSFVLPIDDAAGPAKSGWQRFADAVLT